MKNLAFTFAAAALLFLSPKSSLGAIEAFSWLGVDSFGLYVDTGGGVAGAPITAGVDFTLVSATFSSSASGDLLSVGGIASTGILPVTTSIGLDAPQAFQGPGAPGGNIFTNAGVSEVARGDTFGTGAAVAGIPGEAFGATVDTVAEIELSTNIASSNSGRADAAVTSSSAFVIVPLADIDVVGIFTASSELIADLTPTPPGFSATADISFNIDVTSLGTPVFSWSPNGIAGGITGGTEYLDPFSLNRGVSGFPGFTVGPITDTGLFSAGLTLLAGTPYSFTIEHSSAATATNFGIPEPTTFVVWVFLAISAGSTYRRRPTSRV